MFDVEVVGEEGEGKYLIPYSCCHVMNIPSHVELHVAPFFLSKAGLCNAKIYKKGQKTKVKDLCPVGCEPYKTFKFGKKNNKKIFVCGEMGYGRSKKWGCARRGKEKRKIRSAHFYVKKKPIRNDTSPLTP